MIEYELKKMPFEKLEMEVSVVSIKTRNKFSIFIIPD